MSSISRRGVLGGIAAIGAASAVAGCAPRPEPVGPPPLGSGPFPWGVMSGDPRPNGTVLWTRLNAASLSGIQNVEWQVAADEQFSDLAASGIVSTDASRDHTVKVAVGDLDPNCRWYYRFLFDGEPSSTGIARTSPAVGADIDRLRIAFVSCQMYSEGYYAAYRHILDEDVDFVVHLGDYIYEYGTASEEYGLKKLRIDPVDQPTTLAGYRSKYRLVRRDSDIVECHRQLPLVPIWDDHEVFDDYDRTVDPARRAAAYQAWFENMPFLAPADDPTRVHRQLQWGSLVDMYLMDLAQYRDPEAPAPFVSLSDAGKVAHDDGRTLLGSAQLDSVRNWITNSAASWRVLGNPQMIKPMRLLDLDTPELRAIDPKLPRNAGLYLNGTQWDGYQWERRQVLDHLASANPENNIILTGDIHSWWAGTVQTDIDDPNSPHVAAEFVGSSVTSPGFDCYTGVNIPYASEAVQGALGSFDYVNLFDHGYGVCEVTQDSTRVDFRKVDIDDPGAGVETLVSFRVERGDHRLNRI